VDVGVLGVWEEQRWALERWALERWALVGLVPVGWEQIKWEQIKWDQDLETEWVPRDLVQELPWELNMVLDSERSQVLASLAPA
jgi:hypothetical protein